MLSLDELFGRVGATHDPRSGFARREFASLAAAHPERDYFGIEVHRPGVGHLLMLAATEQSHERAHQHA
jgi:tRNA (guanine-N7-)-methyltransferase